MTRRFVLILTAAASSGCFDFDGAYGQFCDGGRCNGAAGGGSATGGGGGGSTTGGGGSATGGGATTGGGAGGGSSSDAGCRQFLCPVLDWTSPLSSIHDEVAPGLMTESINRFHVIASFEAHHPGRNNFTHFEYRFVDGGLQQTIDRTAGYDRGTETQALRGVSMTDFIVTYRTSATRFEGVARPADFTGCRLSDGRTSAPSHYGVFPVSADEFYLVGHPMSVCKWTRGVGTVATYDPDPTSRVSFRDVYRAPSGALYVVGGNNDSSTGTATGLIVRENGSSLSFSPILDTWYGEGFTSIDGTGSDVYVLGRSNASQRGEIQKLQTDGGFAVVYTAPFRLARLDVMPTGEVWAVGQEPSRVVYFDGGVWADHLLPTTELRSSVTWENINGTTEGVVLTGFEVQPDGGRTALVNTYRRFGR